jgi:GntR family transcriptional regulator
MGLADRKAGVAGMPEIRYRQIAEDLRFKIESGELGRGTQLPTDLELREQYDASRNTVRDAIKLLITRGLAETRPGQGAFVVEKIDPDVTVLTGEAGTSAGEEDIYQQEVTPKLRKPTTTEPRAEIQQSAGMVEGALEVEPGTTVVSRHQQRYIDDIPFSLQTLFYPLSLVTQGADKLIHASDIAEGAVAYLRGEIGLDQIGYRDKIMVRPPDANETAFFKLPDDGRVAVFDFRRTAFDQDYRPFRLSVSVYPSDRNQFTINVGQVPDDLEGSGSLADQQGEHGA